MILPVPHLCQYPDFPTGCESVSAVMALNFSGVPLTADEFIDLYLTKSPFPFDPERAFGGDPRGNGWGCYAPVIEKALRKIAELYPIEIENLSGAPLFALCRRTVSKGVPAILWGSMDMKPVYLLRTWECEGKTIRWLVPQHCLLLTGENKKGYFFNDPQKEAPVFYEKEKTERAYDAFGRQALAVFPQSFTSRSSP